MIKSLQSVILVFTSGNFFLLSKQILCVLFGVHLHPFIHGLFLKRLAVKGLPLGQDLQAISSWFSEIVFRDLTF